MAALSTVALVTVMAASVASAGVMAYSSYQSGQAANSALRYNAKLKEVEAEQGDMETREELRRLRRQNESQLATRRAEIGASGVAGFVGSPLAVLGEEAGRMELAALDHSRANELNRRRLNAEGSMLRWEGSQAKKAANLQAGATILGGVAKAAGSYGG